jgi:ketosteroid isomerase-like protein
MSRENVEAVEGVFAAFNSGGVDAMLETAHPEVEIFSLRAVLEDTSYVGHAGVRQFWKDMVESWGLGLHVDIQAIRDVDPQVVVLGHLTARGVASGADVEADLAWVAGVRDGKLAYLRTYTEHAQALAAVGLAE